MGNQSSKKDVPSSPPDQPCWYDEELPEFDTKDDFMNWLKQKLKAEYNSYPTLKPCELEVRGKVWATFAYKYFRLGPNQYNHHAFCDAADAIGHPYTLKAGSGYIRISFVQFPPKQEVTS